MLEIFLCCSPADRDVAAAISARLKDAAEVTVVLDDADLKVAVNAALNGAYFSTGQRCTASSRLIVTEGIHDRFVTALRERLADSVVDELLDLAAGKHLRLGR